MTSEDYNRKQKQTYFKAYKNLLQLENALKRLKLKEENASRFRVSFLGKASQFYSDKNLENSKESTIKAYWKDLFGKTIEFGTFFNPQIGSVFIVGALVSAFLHKINGKSLATLSSGAYGIFRGIGASETEASDYLKLLNSGSYLLIVRGFENDLQDLDTKLKT
jgi:hypothetical protein